MTFWPTRMRRLVTAVLLALKPLIIFATAASRRPPVPLRKAKKNRPNRAARAGTDGRGKYCRRPLLTQCHPETAFVDKNTMPL